MCSSASNAAMSRATAHLSVHGTWRGSLSPLHLVSGAAVHVRSAVGICESLACAARPEQTAAAHRPAGRSRACSMCAVQAMSRAAAHCLAGGSSLDFGVGSAASLDSGCTSLKPCHMLWAHVCRPTSRDSTRESRASVDAEHLQARKRRAVAHPSTFRAS